MTDNDPEIAVLIDQAEATEARAIDVAMQHIAAYAPFVDAPIAAIDRNLGDFQRIAATRVVTKSEMVDMAGRNIARYIGLLRPRTILHTNMGSVRLAVLAHVAIVITLKALMDCDDLWKAVSGNRWDDASDALLMTEWPVKAKNEEERRRVLELARMMRTGSVPIAWTH